MGKLIDGVWTADVPSALSRAGKFVRQDAQFRNWITPDGQPGITGDGGFPAESGRYHLYMSYACPWAHRTLIFRTLKGLQDHVGVSVVSPLMRDGGWSFDKDQAGATGDHLYGFRHLHEVYQRSAATVSSRVSTPVLWDKERDAIVSNESSEIIRMFNSAFDKITGNSDDYWPQAMRDDIEAINAPIYSNLNNGVYKSGFARTQSAYNDAVGTLFDMLDVLEHRLSQNRYLMGDRITEADWRLFTTLVRFDLVYHFHFKCNRRRIADYPNLWGFTRELYQWPGIAATVNFEHIVNHYYRSHESINPHRIVPINPIIDWQAPHARG